MAVETEIKLRLSEGPEPSRALLDARALLETYGYHAISPRQLETNQTFDLPAGELRSGDRLLRLRSSGECWTVTYKGPAVAGTLHKTREEIEVEVSDGPAFVQILVALGYQPSFAYEKYRTAFKLPGEEGIITLDETPIGAFLELEGPEYWIDQTALRLGFRPGDYITSSYGALYDEHRQKHPTVPRDMKFHHP